MNRWTIRASKAAERLWAQGLSGPEISTALEEVGCCYSPEQIHRHASHNRDRFPIRTLAETNAARSRGIQRSISRGVPWGNARDCQSPPNRTPAAVLDKIEALYVRGDRLQDIALQVGASYDALQKLTARHRDRFPRRSHPGRPRSCGASAREA